MSRKFAAGDRALALSENGDGRWYPCELVSHDNRYEVGFVIAVDAKRSAHPTGYWWSPTRNLRPIYDGDHPASWSDCAWKPKGVQA